MAAGQKDTHAGTVAGRKGLGGLETGNGVQIDRPVRN